MPAIFSRLSFRSEPTVWVSFFRIVLTTAVLFGLSWTPAQTAGVLASLEAFLLLINRAQVSPAAPKPPAEG